MAENLPDLTGKTALVTGASRGLGKASALALAKAGAHVLALARTVGGLEELDDQVKSFGGKMSLIPADLKDAEAIATLGPTLSTRFKKLDMLICAGATLGELTPVRDVDEKIWQAVLDTNLTANWRLLKTLDPLLQAAPNARITMFTSRVGGELARSFWGPYAITKAGLEMLAKTYAEENKNTNIRVSIIDPGAMRTNMRSKAMPGEDPNTLPPAEDIVPLIYHAVSEKYVGIADRLVRRDWEQ